MSRSIHKMRGDGFSFALVDTDITQNGTNSPSFANMTAGEEHIGRVLIAAITCHDDDADDSTFWPATCTIGGVTANKQAGDDLDSGGISVGAAVYSAIVPSGTTATVDITVAFSGTIDDWGCALFRATQINATPVDTDDSQLNEVQLDTSLARFAIFCAADLTGTNTSWSGGGNAQVALIRSEMIVGYDDAPLGGATDSYTVNNDGDAFAGAAYG